MDFGQIVLLVAGLSFIGLGAVPPTPEWGQMISEGALHFYHWWIAAGPGVAILSIVLGFNFLGDAPAGHSRPEVAMSGAPLLQARDLAVTFPGPGGLRLHAVRGVDLDVSDGEVLGMVGESGSGKSVTMLGILGLLPKSAVVTGSARLRGEELLGMAPKALQAIRGARIGMIFQDPLTALNPVLPVGEQIVEAIRIHRDISRKAAMARAVDLLDLVSIPQPRERVRQYPHEFSGGMRQRVMIAIALANEPELLIADEPTTALDVTVQAQILDLLEGLRARLRIGLILITHNLGVVAGMADAVAVMYAGRIVERGHVDAVFDGRAIPTPEACWPRCRSSTPAARPWSVSREGPPSLRDRPPGCAFEPRCALAEARCRAEPPALRFVGSTWCACHLAEAMDRFHLVRDGPSHGRQPMSTATASEPILSVAAW